MRRRPPRLVAAAIGDDGTGGVLTRLTPDSREVIRLAYLEARELGHPCLADEHVLLGLLRHRMSRAAALLEAAGLDLPTARAELERVGPTVDPRLDPAAALRTLGIEPAEVRRRLESTFGADAVHTAERRVRRRPRWRGGHPGPSPLCGYMLAKRSLQIASDLADRRGDARIGPEHLLYGVLTDARDPLGTQVSRRGRRQLAGLGWTAGRANPLRLLLEDRHIDMTQLAGEAGKLRS